LRLNEKIKNVRLALIRGFKIKKVYVRKKWDYERELDVVSLDTNQWDRLEDLQSL
jgi:hypothetical protein